MLRTLLFFFAALFAFQCGFAAGDNMVIDKIDITVVMPEGKEFDKTKISGRMKSKEGDFFSQTDFDSDLKTLAKEYDRIDPSVKVVNGKVQIALKVWPKPTIRSIVFEGNHKKGSKKLLKELAIPICSVFDRKAFNEAFHKLKAYYVKKGFFEAELDYDVRLDTCTNEVDIIVTVCEGRSGVIKKICFEGFDSCEEAAILELMVTKEYSIFTSWFTDEGIYREDAIQHDEFKILGYLQNKGFADAQVNIEVREVAKERIHVIISADKGELYRVGNIRFTGNKLFPDDAIFNEFEIYPGDAYSPELIRETINNITDLYGKYGYIEAFVNYAPEAQGERCYALNITIEEGEQFRVGLIKVFGNCSTQTHVILHETLLVPGEIFNTEKLKLTERKLHNVGFFKKVNVFAVKTEASCLKGNYRDVNIEVEETSTGKFGVFGGYSTSDSLFAGVSISENNFNYRGLFNCWRDGFRNIRGGGEYLNFSVQFGQTSRNYVASWTKPYINDSKWSLGFDIDKSFNHYYSEAYDIDALGLTMRLTREINAFLRFQWHYRIRNSTIHLKSELKKKLKKLEELEKIAAENDDLVDLAVLESELDPHLAHIARTDGAVSATGVNLTYDSTDSPRDPTTGFKSKLELEIAGLGGNFTFWGLAYLNTFYYPLCDCGVLKYRADFRFITPFGRTTYNKLPLDERLFMGGDSMVRGYRPYRLGPHFHGTDIPKGGLSEQLYSIEYDHKLFKKVTGFLFMDVGHLTKEQWSFDFAHYKASVGFGFKLTFLESLPPLSVGMGFPINPVHRNEVKKFFFQIGGKF